MAAVSHDGRAKFLIAVEADHLPSLPPADAVVVSLCAVPAAICDDTFRLALAAFAGSWITLDDLLEHLPLAAVRGVQAAPERGA
jgi:hypothetical protein